MTTVFIFCLSACMIRDDAITQELSALHLIPIGKNVQASVDTTVRHLYLSIDYLKRNDSFYANLLPLLQEPFSRNQSVIFALEPVYSDGRIVEEEVLAEANALKAFMLSVGIPDKQIVLLPFVKTDTPPARTVRVYLQEGF